MGLFQRQDRWYIEYAHNGKRYREVIGPSHKLAQEALNKRLNDIAEQKFFPARYAKTKKFSELIEKYWLLHGQNLKSRSWGLMLVEIKQDLGDKTLSDINAGTIQEFYNKIVKRSSISNANRYLTLIKSIFNKAILWGEYFDPNPCKVKKGQEPMHRERFLTINEMRSLQAACTQRVYPVVMCSILLGMRRGEILNLTWENVNLAQGFLTIARSKTGRPRSLYIPQKLKEILFELCKPSGKVFDLTVTMLRDDFELATKNAGIVGFRFHDLRHTFASHFLMQTKDLKSLQEMLGHTTLQMTQKYAHLLKDYKQTNMTLFEAAIPVRPTNAPFELPVLEILKSPTERPRSSAVEQPPCKRKKIL